MASLRRSGLRRSGLLVIVAGATVATAAVCLSQAQTAAPDPSPFRSSTDAPRSLGPSLSDSSSTADQPPRYGNEAGFGAGSTGFVSSNVSRRARARTRNGKAIPQNPRNGGVIRAAPAVPIGAPIGAAQLRRPVAGTLASTRPGVTPEIPAPGPAPLVHRRPVEQDPYEPLGIHAGKFIIRPGVDITTGYDTNPSRVPGGRPSGQMVYGADLAVRSDWSRHAFNADLRGTYLAYDRESSLNRPVFDGRFNGRIDVTKFTHIELQARGAVATDRPGSPNLPADFARLPIYTAVGGTVGLAQQFNRLEVSARATVDRIDYQNSVLTNGAVVSNRDRDYTQYGGRLRVSYELTPGVKPFVEGNVDTRIRDLPVDAFGLRRDSQGMAGKVGSTFELTRSVTGEMAVGYLVRTYKDPTLPDLQGLTVDGSLVWVASALTTAKLTATSGADETVIPGSAGLFRRDVMLQVDHAFRRWLIGTGRIGYGNDDYRGTGRNDDRYFASVGMTYKLNRDVQLKAELRQEWMRSSQPGVDYTASIALLGLRLQR